MFLAELGGYPPPPIWGKYSLANFGVIPRTPYGKDPQTVFEGLPLIGLTQEIIILPFLEKRENRRIRAKTWN